MMGAITDYLKARAIRTNPAYAAQQALIEKQKQAEEQAQLMASYANRVYGQRPSEGQAGTGVYEEGISPEMKYNLLQQRMLKTGVQGYQDQQADLLKSMQTSVMSNDGAMNRQLAQPFKPTTFTAGVKGRPDWRQPSYFDQQGVVQPAGEAYKIGKGVTVNTGDTNKTETEYDKYMGRHFAEARKGMDTTMIKLDKMARDAQDMVRISEGTGLYSGFAGEKVQALRKLAETLGLEVGENASEAEYITALANNMTKDRDWETCLERL